MRWYLTDSLGYQRMGPKKGRAGCVYNGMKIGRVGVHPPRRQP